MRKAIMHAPTRAVAVLIRVQFQDPFPHRRESMALEDPKRNYTSSNDKIVQGVCTAFCYDTDRWVSNVLYTPWTGVQTSESRGGKVPAEPWGYKKVWTADGRANGKESESARIACVIKYNQWWQETYGVCEPRPERRYQYTEMCGAGEQTSRV